MRELLDKPDSVGDGELSSTGKPIGPRCGVKRGKELVLRKNRRTGELVKQRGFPGVGIAGKRYAKRI